MPSETRFGMASLLSHTKMPYVDGAVSADGQACNSFAHATKY
ncbi:MAG: hypothetical protein HFK09_04320 [Clostridia bacterium]|nr:hypothetical protein [Clostridia bacterium]